MLDLNRKPYYWYPVSGTQLTEDGTKRPFDFRVKFARLPSSRLEELFNPQPDALGNRQVTRDLDIAREVVTGWESVKSDGEEVPFSADALELLLADHHVLSAVITAFMASLKDGLGKPLPMRRGG